MNLQSLKPVHKIVWKVAAAPTGMYRSFSDRSWPSATYRDEPIAMIQGNVAYSTSAANTGKASFNDPVELAVYIAQWANPRLEGKSAFTWRKLKNRYNLLADAKQAVQQALDAHPNFLQAIDALKENIPTKPIS